MGRKRKELELYKRHRPKKLSDILGQDETVNILDTMLNDGNLPHALLFSGPSGVGKTTTARILKSELGCSDGDYTEINIADFRGIDTVRNIRRDMEYLPLSGSCRIWVLDEIHAATKDFQNGLLKPLEDTPEHVYFVLCTTEPRKLIPTILTRCTELRFRPVDSDKVEKLVNEVAKREQLEIFDSVVSKIVQAADGSARKALVILQAVVGWDTEEAQLEAVSKSDTQKLAIDIARALINPRITWKEVAKVIENVDEDAESVRRLVLAYATSVLLKGGNLSNRAASIISAMRDHWYDCGRAGLVLAAWEVIGGK